MLCGQLVALHLPHASSSVACHFFCRGGGGGDSGINSPVVSRCFYVYVHFTTLKMTDLLEVSLFFCLLRHRPGGVGEVTLVNIPSSELVMKLGWGQSGASL